MSVYRRKFSFQDIYGESLLVSLQGNVFTNSNICDDISESGIHEDMSSSNSVSSPIELVLSSSHEAEQKWVIQSEVVN